MHYSEKGRRAVLSFVLLRPLALCGRGAVGITVLYAAADVADSGAGRSASSVDAVERDLLCLPSVDSKWLA